MDFLRMEALMTALRIVREAGKSPEEVLDLKKYEAALQSGDSEEDNVKQPLFDGLCPGNRGYIYRLSDRPQDRKSKGTPAGH